MSATLEDLTAARAFEHLARAVRNRLTVSARFQIAKLRALGWKIEPPEGEGDHDNEDE